MSYYLYRCTGIIVLKGLTGEMSSIKLLAIWLIRRVLMDRFARQRLREVLKRVQGDRSVRQFAIDLDVALGTMQNWLQGTGLPSTRNLEKIARSAGMSVQELHDELVGNKNTPPEPKSPRDVFQVAVRNLDDEGLRELIKLLVEAIGR